MNTVSLTLNEILELAKKTLLANGCDEENASILADTIMRAERDGSVSHGLFRLPAYVAGLKSKKINGKARPELENVAPSIIKVLGNNAVAPMVLSLGLPAVIDLAKKNGVAVLAIKNSHHMAALWPETEAIAEAGLGSLNECDVNVEILFFTNIFKYLRNNCVLFKGKLAGQYNITRIKSR